MKRYEVIFADLDGTLIDTVSGKTFPQGIWDMKLRFEVLDKIKIITPKCLSIVTNQGGIASGFVNHANFKVKLEYICHAIAEYCGCVVNAAYCPSNDKVDPNRKPNTKMLEQLSTSYVGDNFEIIKTVSLMIGDASGKEYQFSDSDKKTAENFGIDYMDVEDFINSSYE